jgi:hypothetical protein
MCRRERGQSNVGLNMSSIFTIHLSEQDKKSVPKSSLLLKDVLGKR